MDASPCLFRTNLFFAHLYVCLYVCVQVFQNAQELLQGYQVHPEIQAQMFAYLFFFSNVSLFNQLMDKGKVESTLTYTPSLPLELPQGPCTC